MELISREEAMLSVRNLKEVMLTNAEVINALYHVPTIESRSKGKWVKYKGEIYGFECSLCGKPAPLESEYGAYPCEKTNYCPNCGADMRGEEL